MAKILIMEDEPLQVEAWTEILKDEGHEVLASGNASEALAIAQRERIDLVITDVIVHRNARPSPEGGVLLIGRLRMLRHSETQPWLRDLPIIAVSGAGVGQDEGFGSPLKIAKEVGADLALEKPISRSSLLNAIESVSRRDA